MHNFLISISSIIFLHVVVKPFLYLNVLRAYPTNIGDEELQKSKVGCFDAIRELRKKLQESMEVENSEVYADIATKYPVDLEVVKSCLSDTVMLECLHELYFCKFCAC